VSKVNRVLTRLTMQIPPDSMLIMIFHPIV
jgi:hypothetical protein